jgi:hypothetical protein
MLFRVCFMLASSNVACYSCWPEFDFFFFFYYVVQVITTSIIMIWARKLV